MTFTELIAALALFTVFMAGLSGAVLPLCEAAARSDRLFVAARESEFVIDSFRSACRSGPADFSAWKRAVSVVEAIGDLSIEPVYAPGGAPVWVLSCTVHGKEITVYGEGALP